jgi:hypothetical protein
VPPTRLLAVWRWVVLGLVIAVTVMVLMLLARP